MLRRFLAGLALSVLAATLTPAASRAADDPVATIKAIYALYQAKNTKLEDTPDQLDPKYYSARRKTQLAALTRACEGKDMCFPDFDHLVNGQDYKITALVLKRLPSPASAPGPVKVDVRFRNFSTSQHFTFTMVQEGSGWLIDEMEGGSKDTRYTLDDVFKPNF